MDTILISNDTLDQMEALSEKINETTKLDEKIRLHNDLNNYVKSVESVIDEMCELVDNIDFEKTCDDTIDYDIDAVNVEQLMSESNDEPILQNKIKYMQQILMHISKCKKVCEKNKLVITKC
jgi:hypothetical protein